MDKPVRSLTQVEAERSDWKAEYERRLSTLDEKSAKARQEFNDWLNGFRVKGILAAGGVPPSA